MSDDYVNFDDIEIIKSKKDNNIITENDIDLVFHDDINENVVNENTSNDSLEKNYSEKIKILSKLSKLQQKYPHIIFPHLHITDDIKLINTIYNKYRIDLIKHLNNQNTPQFTQTIQSFNTDNTEDYIEKSIKLFLNKIVSLYDPKDIYDYKNK